MNTAKNKFFYGWSLVASFAVIGTIIWGIRFSYGVFFKSLETEFDLSRASTSAIFSLYMVLCAAMSIPAGYALDKYGPKLLIIIMGVFAGLGVIATSLTNASWQLFITYSLLIALGTAPMYLIVMSTVSRWFDKKKGAALGFASIGSGLGSVVMAPLATILISHFDWRWAFVILGIIVWVVVLPPARWLKKDPRDIGLLPDGAKTIGADMQEKGGAGKPNSIADLTLKSSLVTRSFWLFFFAYTLHAFCQFMAVTHVVPHATDVGFSASQGATILSLFGFTTIAGRMILGPLSDKAGTKTICVVCMFFQTAGAFSLIWSQELWMFYAFAGLYGLGYGGMSPTIAALISDSFGLSKLGTILGVLNTGFGIGAGVGPFVGGYVYDATQSYYLAWIMATGAMFIAVVLIMLTRRERGRLKTA